MTWTKEMIKDKITTNNEWLERSVIAIYNLQTAQEQYIDESVQENGVGFNKPDSSYLSYIARYLKSGRHISGHHVEKARSKMLKYSGQLTKIANKEI